MRSQAYSTALLQPPETPNRELSNVIPKLLTHQNCEIMNTYCLQQLSVGSYVMQYWVTHTYFKNPQVHKDVAILFLHNWTQPPFQLTKKNKNSIQRNVSLPFPVGCVQFSSVQFSRSVLSDSLRPHELQHARPPCPSPAPRAYPNSCRLSWWWHPTISSPVVPFSSCPRSVLASGSFQMSQLFPSGSQSIGVSASTSVLPMNTQDWYPLRWTCLISLQSKGLSRVFSNTTF